MTHVQLEPNTAKPADEYRQQKRRGAKFCCHTLESIPFLQLLVDASISCSEKAVVEYIAVQHLAKLVGKNQRFPQAKAAQFIKKKLELQENVST